MNSAPVGVLLLAAGYSRRFGSDKRLYRLDGKPLLQHAIDSIKASQLPLRVCIRQQDDPVLELLAGLAVEAVVCERSQEGMGVSLAQGIAHCDDWRGALIALGDMPWVLPVTYARLAQSMRANHIVQPQYNGRAGNPVGFSAQYFSQLQRLRGDSGARGVVDAHRQFVDTIVVDDAGIFRDVDFQQD